MTINMEIKIRSWLENPTLQEWLIQMGACEEGLEWIGERTSFQECWETRQDQAWMFWAICRLPTNPIVGGAKTADELRSIIPRPNVSWMKGQ